MVLDCEGKKRFYYCLNAKLRLILIYSTFVGTLPLKFRSLLHFRVQTSDLPTFSNESMRVS